MQNTITKACASVVSRSLLPFLVFALTILFLIPAWAGDVSKDDETLKNAADVLQQMLKDNSIPVDVFTKADCVIVLPNVKKFAIGIGGGGGRGPMVCRTGDQFNGRWSAPAMFSLGGVSAGFQIGGSSSDFVLLVMTEKGANAILNGKSKLGRDATAAAGPTGAKATSVSGNDVLTYARAKGLFAGVSLSGASLEQDNDANKRLYGKPLSASEIVRLNQVQTPSGGVVLVSLLNSKTARN